MLKRVEELPLTIQNEQDGGTCCLTVTNEQEGEVPSLTDYNNGSHM